jgi:hypothetical protein
LPRTDCGGLLGDRRVSECGFLQRGPTKKQIAVARERGGVSVGFHDLLDAIHLVMTDEEVGVNARSQTGRIVHAAEVGFL